MTVWKDATCTPVYRKGVSPDADHDQYRGRDPDRDKILDHDQDQHWDWDRVLDRVSFVPSGVGVVVERLRLAVLVHDSRDPGGSEHFCRIVRDQDRCGERQGQCVAHVR